MSTELGAWNLAESDLRLQRLYRAQVRQGDRETTVRLVLRLVDTDRFELAASDALGRPLWSLAIAGGWARFVEGGARSGCRLAASASLRLPRIDWELPVLDLPAVLVGRLPATPAASGANADAVDFRDQRGWRWTASRDALGPLRWTLWRGGVPAVRWERTDRGGRLDSRDGQLQVRWREGAREPIAAGGSGSVPAPEGEPECEHGDLS